MTKPDLAERIVRAVFNHGFIDENELISEHDTIARGLDRATAVVREEIATTETPEPSVEDALAKLREKFPDASDLAIKIEQTSRSLGSSHTEFHYTQITLGNNREIASEAGETASASLAAALAAALSSEE